MATDCQAGLAPGSAAVGFCLYILSIRAFGVTHVAVLLALSLDVPVRAVCVPLVLHRVWVLSLIILRPVASGLYSNTCMAGHARALARRHLEHMQKACTNGLVCDRSSG